MADDSNEQDAQSSSGGAREFSQADVDALLNGASNASPGASREDPGDSPAPSEVQATRSDADAPGASSPATTEASAEPATESAGAVTQADVDALLGAARAGGDLPEANPSEADSEEELQHPATRPFEFRDFEGAQPIHVDPKRVTMLNDVNLRVRLQLGRTRMLLEDVLSLGEGSVVELDKLAGDPVDVLVNDRLIARGEVLVLNDVFCVRVCEVLSNDPHRITV